MVQHGTAPTVGELLVWIVLLEVLLPGIAWLLDPPRKKET